MRTKKDAQADARRRPQQAKGDKSAPSWLPEVRPFLWRAGHIPGLFYLLSAGWLYVAGWWWLAGGTGLTKIERDQTRPTPQYLVNLNDCEAMELSQIPDIGPTLATRILNMRQTLGRYDSVDQLNEVDGIGGKTLERIRPFVYCGPTANP